MIAQNDPKKAGGDETGEIYNADDISCPDIVLRGICTRAWDTRWQFKQEDRSNDYDSGTRGIEMQKKFDYDSMNRFKGTSDSSNGYTVMRNLNGATMRGYQRDKVHL